MDLPERQNLFALAMNRPPSEQMQGACGAGPIKEQMRSSGRSN
jgi:hypothetical protein